MGRFKIKKKIIISVIFVVAVVVGFKVYIQPNHSTPILMYHYVNEEPGSLSVSPENFRKQMRYLKERGYQVISMDDFVRAKNSGRKLPFNWVVITFDDGRDDNYENAYPVLKEYGFPATIFIISQLVDKEPYLTWEQVREMSQNGIDFGSHTRHHRYLPDLPEDELRNEIFNSKKDIEDVLNKQINHFCYPSGGFTKLSKELMREAGYLSATTTNRGAYRDNKDLYELNRIKITNSDAVRPFNFAIKLSGYYNLFRRSRSGH